jgi:serine/threonine-protein kinase
VYYTTRDYVDGWTLQEVLESGKKYEPVQVIRILRQILEGLTPVHRAGIFHGGVKPSNIFITRDDRVILGDLSLPLHELPVPTNRLSYDYRYAAPEMFRGEGKAGPPADYYALGCVAFELLCGRPPFEADNYHELIDKHVREPIPSASGCAFFLTASGNIFLERLLAKSPSDRFSALDQLLRALDSLQDAVQSKPQQPTPLPRRLLDAASMARLDIGQSLLPLPSSKPPPSPSSLATRPPVNNSDPAASAQSDHSDPDISAQSIVLAETSVPIVSPEQPQSQVSLGDPQTGHPPAAIVELKESTPLVAAPLDHLVGDEAVSLEDNNRLQVAIWRLEIAWQREETIDLTELLPVAGNSVRMLFLHELIKVDLEIRYRLAKDVWRLEDYLRRYPILAIPGTLDMRLIFAEYRIRHLYGDKPTLESYKDRFPDLFEALARRIQDEPQTLVPQADSPIPVENKSASSLPTPDERFLPLSGTGYRLVRILGEGGFAEVHEAEASGGVRVAIKILKQRLDSELARQELQALNRYKNLNHPYLIKVNAIGLNEGHLHIVMELAQGTLMDRLKECQKAGPLGIPKYELLGYMEDIAEALDFLHDENLVHRDVKPANMLILDSQNRRVSDRQRSRNRAHAKLSDCGLVRIIDKTMEKAEFQGTWAYAAPEAFREQLARRSDQFSLAVSYVELRRGRLPWGETNPFRLMNEIISGEPDLNYLEPAEREVVRRALAKDPENRFSSCGEFVMELHAVLMRSVSSPVPQNFHISFDPSAPPIGMVQDELVQSADSAAISKMLREYVTAGSEQSAGGVDSSNMLQECVNDELEYIGGAAATPRAEEELKLRQPAFRFGRKLWLAVLILALLLLLLSWLR